LEGEDIVDRKVKLRYDEFEERLQGCVEGLSKE